MSPKKPSKKPYRVETRSHNKGFVKKEDAIAFAEKHAPARVSGPSGFTAMLGKPSKKRIQKKFESCVTKVKPKMGDAAFGICTKSVRSKYGKKTADEALKPVRRKAAKKAAATRRARENPSERRNEWRKRQIVLPTNVVNEVFDWHGGARTPSYALASSGKQYLVSVSMIDAATEELRGVLRSLKNSDDRKKLRSTLVNLSDVRRFWREHDARSAGMEMKASEYEYDGRNYGLSEEEEREIRF